jgi:hypothetical protein
MPESLKKLPVATQAFSNLIEGNYVYIDKTDLIYNLIDNEAVFLSRPRRFGKSLLLSTVEEIFHGNKYLFEGLKIASTNYSFNKHPVVYLDLSIPSYSKEVLREGLLTLVTDIAEEEDFNISSSIPSLAFRSLIKKLYKKYSQKVVVLIDEYDEPVSSHVDDIELAKSNSEILRYFYSSLKSCNKELRFVLVTGVTRYALMGLSAGLNHLIDISFNPQYSAICGFTPIEMDYYLGNRYYTLLNSLKSASLLPPESTVDDLRKLLLTWYDGYSWDGNIRVLNPISILKSFYDYKIDTFWYDTAPSRKFISNIFNKSLLEVTEDKLKNISGEYFRSATVDELNIPVLLFQTGYLTIDNIEFINKDELMIETFNLKTPNSELQGKINHFYLEALAHYLIKDAPKERVQLFQAITRRDGHQLSNIVAAIYKEVPAVHHTGKANTESFYHSILWACWKMLVPLAKMEQPDSGGNLDLLLVLDDDTHVVIELKYSKDNRQKNVGKVLDRLAKKALKSISSHDYGGHYRLQGKKFVTIGLGVFGRGQVKAVFGQQPPKR